MPHQFWKEGMLKKGHSKHKETKTVGQIFKPDKHKLVIQIFSSIFCKPIEGSLAAPKSRQVRS